MAPWGLNQDALRTELRSELAELRTEITGKTAERVLMHEELLREFDHMKAMLLSDFASQVLRPELNTLSEHLESVVREEMAVKHLGVLPGGFKKQISPCSRSPRTSQGTANDGTLDHVGGARELAFAPITEEGLPLDEDGFLLSSRDVMRFTGYDPDHPYAPLLAMDDEEDGDEQQPSSRKTLGFHLKKIVQATKAAEESNISTWEGFLQGHRFHTVVSALVVLNLISLGLETDNAARNFDKAKPQIYEVSEVGFLIIFIFELLFRFAVYRWDIFSQMDANLTMLDTAAICLQIINTFYPGLFGNYDVNFLALRVFRLSKALNTMHVTNENNIGSLLSEFRMILSTLVGSLRSLLWVGGFLFLTTYCFSNYIMKILSHHWKLNPDSIHDREMQEIRAFYGSMGASMLTLYQVLTDGIEWRYACQPLMDHLPENSAGIALGFVIYVAFALFVLLNVITGLFLSAAQESAEADKIRLYRDEMRRVFENTDSDGSGDISYFELESQLGSPQFQHCLEMLGLAEDNVLDLFEILDEDKSGSINSDEFVDGCVRLTGTTKAIDFAVFRTHYEDDVRETNREIARCKDLLYQVVNALGASESES